MSKTVKKLASIALPIIGNAIAPGIGGIVGGAAGGALGGKGLKGAILGGLGSFAGNALGKTPIGSLLGSSNKMGPFTLGNLGNTALNSIGNQIANTSLGSVANVASGAISDGLFDSDDKPKSTGPAPFQPTRAPSVDLPSSLAGFSGQDEAQQSSNLATQGVYGGGLGGEEQAYFTNLINRRLIDESGNLDADLSEVNPIEQSYLAQIGLGGYQDTRSLLEALSKWKAQ